MSQPSKGAGLVHAPPYDSTSELDPATAEALREQSDDIHSLAYYKEQHDRQTLRGRGLLLAIIFVMLAGNMYLTWQTRASVMTNLDQTRLDQAALSDMVQTRVSTLESRVVALAEELTAAPAEPEAVTVSE